MAPILAVAEQYPIAVPLTLVGYTSGVYTYKTWNPPVAKARMMNRNKVRTSLQWKGTVLEIQTLAYSLLYSHQSWVFTAGELNNVCVHLCGNYTFCVWFISQCMVVSPGEKISTLLVGKSIHNPTLNLQHSANV